MKRTKDDGNRLSQLLGSIKRARTTVLGSTAQIVKLGECEDCHAITALNRAAVKSLHQSRYWLDQAVDILEHSIRRVRETEDADGKRATARVPHISPEAELAATVGRMRDDMYDMCHED